MTLPAHCQHWLEHRRCWLLASADPSAPLLISAEGRSLSQPQLLARWQSAEVDVLFAAVGVDYRDFFRLGHWARAQLSEAEVVPLAPQQVCLSASYAIAPHAAKRMLALDAVPSPQHSLADVFLSQGLRVGVCRPALEPCSLQLMGTQHSFDPVLWDWFDQHWQQPSTETKTHHPQPLGDIPSVIARWWAMDSDVVRHFLSTETAPQQQQQRRLWMAHLLAFLNSKGTLP